MDWTFWRPGCGEPEKNPEIKKAASGAFIVFAPAAARSAHLRRHPVAWPGNRPVLQYVVPASRGPVVAISTAFEVTPVPCHGPPARSVCHDAGCTPGNWPGLRAPHHD